MANSRVKVVWGYRVVALAGAVTILVASRIPRPPSPNAAWYAAAAGLAIAWGMLFALMSWRAKDEFGREAEKWSWWWGGLIGLSASLPVYVFIQWGGAHRLDASIPVGGLFAQGFLWGMLLPVLSQVAGFMIAAAVWKAAKR